MKAKKKKKKLREALKVLATIDDVWTREGGHHRCTVCLGCRVVGHTDDCPVGRFMGKNASLLQAALNDSK